MKKLAIVFFAAILLGSLVWAVGKDQRIYASDYCWTTNGMQRTSAELNTMISAIGDTRMWAVIDGEFSITNDVTFNANTLLEYTHKTGFDVDSGVTLTINGPIFNPFTNDVYSGSGTVVLSDTGPVMEILNGGTSGTTGQIARAGNDVTITFPEGGGGTTNLTTLTNAIFYAYSSTQTTVAVDTTVKIPFDTELFDNLNAFDTNTFTVPDDGKYVFSSGMVYTNGANSRQMWIMVYTNGTEACRMGGSIGSGNMPRFIVSPPLPLSSGQTVDLYLQNVETGVGAIITNSPGPGNHWFSGYKIDEYEIYGVGGSSATTGGPAVKHEFSVYISVPETNPIGTTAKVQWDVERFDDGNNFDLGNARYTAPESGLYSFNTACAQSNASGLSSIVHLYRNGTNLYQHQLYSPGETTRGTVWQPVDVTAGDYFEIFYENSDSVFTATNDFGPDKTWFTGFMFSEGVGSETNAYSFSAYCSTNYSIPAGTIIKMPIDTESFDIGDNFSASNTYNIPSDGVYSFALSAGSTTQRTFGVALYTNGVLAREAPGETDLNPNDQDLTVTLQLSEGTWVEAYIDSLQTTFSAEGAGGVSSNWFSGYKVQ